MSSKVEAKTTKAMSLHIAPKVINPQSAREPEGRNLNVFNGGFEVDGSLDPSQRPLIPLDIERWRGLNSLSMNDAIYLMAFRSSSSYKRLLDAPSLALPLTTELLLRAYHLNPGGPSWAQMNIKAVYHELYGDVLAKAALHGRSESARVRLYCRFPAQLGRPASSCYRWIETSAEPTTPVLRLLAKLEVNVEGFGERLDSLAQQCWALRGHDFNAEYPMP